MLFRLRGCEARSAPLLFAKGKSRFSHDEPHIKTYGGFKHCHNSVEIKV